MREVVNTPDAPGSPLYSQAVKAGQYVTWFPVDAPTRYVAKLGVEIPDLLVSIRMTAFVG